MAEAADAYKGSVHWVNRWVERGRATPGHIVEVIVAETIPAAAGQEHTEG
jgi:hypothetical protein